MPRANSLPIPIRRSAVAVVCLLAAVLAAAWQVHAAPNASGLILVPIAEGLSQPVFVTHAGDGTNRLFVVEKGGRIKIIQNGGVLVAPFLDISDRVENSGESGLLSVAFPPDFASRGYFFVYYNHKDKNLVPAPDGEPNLGYDTVVARFRVTQDPNRADPASEERILLRNQPYANHNGGLIGFGPDDYLYVGLGDGGSGGDPENSGQRLNTILGKILRLAVDGTGTYTIPPDNPFVSAANARDEIWDYGLRNPWRWSFDRLTGDLYIGDVGQNKFEEISVHPAGRQPGINFGWRVCEGFHRYPDSSQPCPSTYEAPITEYGRDEGQSITGGYVYRGSRYPSLVGKYFFADFSQGKIWSMQEVQNGWTPRLLELDTGYAIASFGEDAAGELYVVDLNGGVYAVTTNEPAPIPDLSTSTKQVTPPTAASGQLVLYTVALNNTGDAVSGTVAFTDVLPAGLAYVPGSLRASAGSVDDTQAPTLYWRGSLGGNSSITLHYEAIVDEGVLGVLANQAGVTGPGFVPLSLQADLIVSESPAPPQPDFFLPGTQPSHLVDPIADPETCQACHTEPIYAAWRGSLMSQAGRDPLMWAALAVANEDAPGAGEFCLRCHTPRGWFAGRSTSADGSGLQSGDVAAGVACEVCHRMVDPVDTGAVDAASERDAVLRSVISPTLPAEHVGTAMLILDPVDNRRGPFVIDPAPPHPWATWQTGLLGQDQDPVTEARVCGSCHNLDNPTLSWDPQRGQYWPNESNQPAPSFAKGDLFPIERTYDEWFHSSYATTAGVYAPQFAGAKADGIVRTCQDCHMPRTIGPAAYGDVNRDCRTNGCLPEHGLIGGNSWVPQLLKDSRWRLNAAADAGELDRATTLARQMIAHSATLSVTLVENGATNLVTVRVTNETGHKLPTGYPEGRRMWLAVTAYDADHNVVFQSGAYDPTTGVLSGDPFLKVYEVKQGLTPELAAEKGLTAGESFHFVLNNTYLKDNRIPPRGYTQAAFDVAGLRPVGAAYADGQHWDDTTYDVPSETTSVVVVLYYQTASKEYVDFLRSNGGADGIALGQLWDGSKSPPVAAAVAFDPPRVLYLPVVKNRSAE